MLAVAKVAGTIVSPLFAHADGTDATATAAQYSVALAGRLVTW